MRRGVRAGVESYSIKKLEPFYEFERETALADANVALVKLQAALELDDVPSIPDEVKAIVVAYNKDDCLSAAGLRQWLETLRGRLVAGGAEVLRPQPGGRDPSEKITDWQIRIAALVEKLTANVPVDPEERDQEQQARWILANVLDWHRREEKAVWWEFFRLAGLPAEDLLDERVGLSGLTFVRDVPGSGRTPCIDTGSLRRKPSCAGPKRFAMRAATGWARSRQSPSRNVPSISRSGRTASPSTPELSLLTSVLTLRSRRMHSRGSGSMWRRMDCVDKGATRPRADLLLKAVPRAGGEALHRHGETTVQAAIRLCAHLTCGILPIQGPPRGREDLYRRAHDLRAGAPGQESGHYGKQPQGHPQPDRRGHRRGR